MGEPEKELWFLNRGAMRRCAGWCRENGNEQSNKREVPAVGVSSSPLLQFATGLDLSKRPNLSAPSHAHGSKCLKHVRGNPRSGTPKGVSVPGRCSLVRSRRASAAPGDMAGNGGRLYLARWTPSLPLRVSTFI